MSITLEQLLASKEARQQRQQRLRKHYGTAIASITISIPGSTKDSTVIRQLCAYAANALHLEFAVLAMESVNLPTGPEAVLAIDAEARELKKAAIILEESHPFGRLLDIDVISADGTHLSRQESRTRPRPGPSRMAPP